MYKTASALLRMVLVLPALAGICRADDVIRFRVQPPASAAWIRDYWVISRKNRTVEPGDSIEYDVYLNCRAPGLGGIEIKNSDGTYWRDLADWHDQNGIPGHPNADISAYAYGRWYHRKLAVPSSAIGKTITQWEIAVDGYHGGNAPLSCQYDNIVVTNGGKVVLTIYQDGEADCVELDFKRSAETENLLVGPIRKPNTQVGAFLFYWYDAPNNNASPNLMPYHPHGLVGDPWIGYNNGYYSMRNQYWWEAEFQDMRRAGVDIAALVCWGDALSVANYMVPALERSGCGIKIALFDDTTSECCEWNVDNGRSYFPDPKMPLSDQSNWVYFYDRKIKPFFAAIPRKYWATHNGASLEEGGRPIIMTYTAGWFKDVSTHGTALWQWVKDRFAADFKDANGNGIVPWVIHDHSWFQQGGAGSADGHYAWGAAVCSGITYELADYRVSTIGPGYDDRLIRNPGTFADRYDGRRLVNSFNGQSAFNSHLIMLETWNELWEGTAVQRCKDYPTSTGGFFPETYYIDLSRELVKSSVGLNELDATFLRTWEIPATFKRGSVMSLKVRNDGFLPWTPGEYSLGGRLLDASTRQVIPGTERVLAGLPESVPSGGEVSIGFNVPSDWPNATSYLIQLDMMRGSEWFSSLGADQPVTTLINLNPSDTTAPSRVSNFAAEAGQKKITLRWTNPGTPDFRSTVIRMSTTSYPSSITSGTLVAHRFAAPGSSDSCVVENLTPGVQYYFSAFAQDAVGNVSSARNAAGAPVSDTTPPGTVSGFAARLVTMNTVVLTWTNPPDLDYRSTIVRYSTVGYPTGPTDGLPVCSQSLLPGTTGAFVHQNLPQGRTYYYSAFACDAYSNYSAPAHTSITLMWIDCSTVKLLPDGVEVELRGNIVTGIYPEHGGFYIEQPNRLAGIRVSGIPQGLQVGDIVDVVGTIDTYRPDMYTAVERQVRGSVTKTGYAGPLKPWMMNCRSVGGQPIPPYVPGVNDPFGPNNIGLLVRIVGRVTEVVTKYLVVDDGSNVRDVGNRIGVLVECPGPPGALLGRTVVATGVVCGSRPINWQTNRRLIRLRDWNDLLIAD
jgi:hypothetical protein